MPHKFRLFIGLILLLAGCSATAAVDPLAAQREQFIEARKALKQKQVSRYRELAAGLKTYPLYPYLEFDALRQRLGDASEREVLDFAKRHADTPLAARLKSLWLYTLASQRRWELFLKHYTGSKNTGMQCYALRARLNTGRKKGLVDDTLEVWTAGKSLPKACDPLFDWLYAGNHVSDEHVWERIRLAMGKGQTSLARYLAKRLPAKDAEWVSLWRQAHRNPSDTLGNPRLDRDTDIAREIILHAIRRIARSDAASAHTRWESVKDGYSFTPSQRGVLERYIALSAAQQHRPGAHDLLGALPDEQRDAHARDWQLRAAVTEADWPALLADIEALPDEERQRDEWRYWRAYALDKTNRRLEATNEYSWLAKERDYHGFLAADYLGWPYEMGDAPTRYDPDELENLAGRPAMLRARELFRADMMTDARREWAYATRNMSDAELKLAAVLARQWGWNDHAILTVARAGEFSDLTLRFPLEHTESVRRHAHNNNLEPGIVFAVIRQESAFNPEARSSAGARGLMQLMPKTGKATARLNRIPWTGVAGLYDTDRNIRLGSSYLRQVMERFGNNIVLASASYNAGPHRVTRWLPDAGELPASHWVARIPYSETRKYVQRVLAYAAIYDWRMQQPITPLRERMPDVQEESAYRQSSG
jgi:soluble lytic murein transglycosylase